MTFHCLSRTFAPLALMLALPACQPVDTALDSLVNRIATEDIKLDADGAPRAKITPEGDLVVDGNTVQIDSEQRRLLIAYRERIAAISAQGAAIGKQGAALGRDAAKDALTGLFSGQGGNIRERITAQAEELTHEAMKICDTLEGLKQAQDALVASLPEFAPYAGLDQDSVSDCRAQ